MIGDLARTGRAGANLLATNGTIEAELAGMKVGAATAGRAAPTALTAASGSNRKPAEDKAAIRRHGRKTKPPLTLFKLWAKKPRAVRSHSSKCLVFWIFGFCFFWIFGCLDLWMFGLLGL